MTNLPLAFNDDTMPDDTPLPLIVAKRWNFPLVYVELEGGILYAIQDWMRGLIGEEEYSESLVNV